MREIYLIGCASGTAGADEHSGDGPIVIQKSPFLQTLSSENIHAVWQEMLQPVENKNKRVDEIVGDLCRELADKVVSVTEQNKFPIVIGGDHSCAVGTWSGVYDANHDKGDIGLIWIDAHMDSHTPETSESGRIHGMPLAAILGYGYPTLTSILNVSPKIKPENLCLIGVRSFERGEAELLHRLNVKIFTMDDVAAKGMDAVMDEAISHVNRHTMGFGVTIDIDALDPNDAPGVDVPEVNGISAEDLCRSLESVAKNPKLIAAEIVEFDPSRDIEHKTEKIVVELINIIARQKAS